MPASPAPWTLHGDAAALLVPRGVGGAPTLLGWIRYADSDVGPYDELLLVRLRGRRPHTVERIYVSTERSREEGRRNWGVPKEVARFEVIAEDGAERVQAWVGERAIASFRVKRRGPALPFSTALLPERARTVEQVLEGRRFRFAPSARGRLQAVTFRDVRLDPEFFSGLGALRWRPGISLQAFTLVMSAATTTTLH